jgi:ectoine hydroxylase-related dioxygenase (phytanoyl-CoA dioxygenase family)
VTDALTRDGFAVLERFVAPHEVAALRAEVDAVLSAPLAPGCERPHNTLAPLRWDDPIVERVLSAPARMRALAHAVAGRDLRWISGYVSVKDARSGPLWWHQDWWCWEHPVTYRRAAAQVAVLCYLSDTDADRGALRVLPGSHRRSTPLHAALPEAHARPAGDLHPDHEAVADHPGQVTLALGAGDAVVIDYRLLHATHANRGDVRRDCVLLSFVPSWRDLPEDVRAHLIRHPAQPADRDRERERGALLPEFAGTPRDLPLDRVPPERFAIGAEAQWRRVQSALTTARGSPRG